MRCFDKDLNWTEILDNPSWNDIKSNPDLFNSTPEEIADIEKFVSDNPVCAGFTEQSLITFCEGFTDELDDDLKEFEEDLAPCHYHINEQDIQAILNDANYDTEFYAESFTENLPFVRNLYKILPESLADILSDCVKTYVEDYLNESLDAWVEENTPDEPDWDDPER